MNGSSICRAVNRLGLIFDNVVIFTIFAAFLRKLDVTLQDNRE